MNNTFLYNKKIIIALCIIIPPIGLWLIWKRDTNLWKKLVATPVSLFFLLLIIAKINMASMTDEERSQMKKRNELKELASQQAETKLRFEKELKNLELYDLDSTRKVYINALEQTPIYKDIVVNKKVSIEYLRYLSILNEYHINLTASDESGKLKYNTFIENESLEFVNSSETNKDFFNLNFALLEEMGFSKGIILAFIRYSKTYGYYGGNNDTIPFYYNLIPTIIKYAPKDHHLLDVFCKSYNLKFSNLDNGQGYVNPWFRNKEVFNKHLRIEYPSSDCYVDHDQIKAERQEDFQDDCMGGGYCFNVKYYTKDNMNDPDSFEHVETKTYDRGDYCLVIMKYRGNNVFGAKVIGVIEAKVGWNCEILEIIR